MTEVSFDLVANLGEEGFEWGSVIDAVIPDTPGRLEWAVWGGFASAGNQQRTVYVLNVPSGSWNYAALAFKVTTVDNGPVNVYELSKMPIPNQTTWNSRAFGDTWTNSGGDRVIPYVDTAVVSYVDQVVELEIGSVCSSHRGGQVYLLFEVEAVAGNLVVGEAESGYGLEPFYFVSREA
jgi:hypothetical protein